MNESQLDRDWYDQEEDGTCLDLTKNHEVQEIKPCVVPRKRVSEKHLQNIRDTDRWEHTKLKQIGLASILEYDSNLDQDHNVSTVQLIVHEKPPLLRRPFDSPSFRTSANSLRDHPDWSPDTA